MYIGADTLQKDNAIRGGLISVHVLPRHLDVHQALLLQHHMQAVRQMGPFGTAALTG